MDFEYHHGFACCAWPGAFLALAVSVGSGGLTCTDTSFSALTSVYCAAMNQQHKDDYTLKYKCDCDQQILEMGSVMFEQLGTLSGAISYDSPVATAVRSFYGMSSNVATVRASN